MDTVEVLREREGRKYGGSAEGIRDHYDISNDFWPNILKSTMAYSSAMFVNDQEDLDSAQNRKINWHIHNSGAHQARSVLDIGCGWGSVLKPLSEISGIDRIVGLTLSEAQAEYLTEKKYSKTEVRVENWTDHKLDSTYDAIISVGAFEHFAKPNETQEEKIAVYRDFFQRCHQWLSPKGRMTLQTIAFGNMDRKNASDFMNNVIFPESDLPYLDDVVEASKGIFEIVAHRNDRIDYAITMDCWGKNLRANRKQALKQVGEKKVEDMERYFKMASVGFRMGKQHLLRFSLRPISNKWTVAGSEDWSSKCFGLS